MPTASKMYREYLKSKNCKGTIFMFDFNSPDNKAILMPIEGKGWDGDFSPHGIGHWENTKTGT